MGGWRYSNADPDDILDDLATASLSWIGPFPDIAIFVSLDATDGHSTPGDVLLYPLTDRGERWLREHVCGTGSAVQNTILH